MLGLLGCNAKIDEQPPDPVTFKAQAPRAAVRAIKKYPSSEGQPYTLVEIALDRLHQGQLSFTLECPSHPRQTGRVRFPKASDQTQIALPNEGVQNEACILTLVLEPPAGKGLAASDPQKFLVTATDATPLIPLNAAPPSADP